MTTTSIITIALLGIIIVLLLVLVFRKKDTDSSKETGLAVRTDAPDTVGISQVSELVLKNALGQELTFTKPNELTDKKYVEITSGSRAGNVIQHVSGAAMPEIQKAQTLNQLKEMAPNGLFTSQVPKANLSQYKLDGSFSSVQYSSKGVQTHKGFTEVDSSALQNISPASVANITMQGMAAVSGQYYMKQITDSLAKIESGLDKLQKAHKYEKLGILINARKSLQAITEKGYCDAADLIQIRSLSDKSGEVLEEYKLAYSDAYRELMSYSFKGGLAKSALEEYNDKIYELKDVMSICMIADRIVAEAKLAEMVARGKINATDPAIYELSEELERHSLTGFNGEIRHDIHGSFSPLLEKANAISEKSIEGTIFGDEEHRKKRLNAIKNNVKEIKRDIVVMTDSVYGRREESGEQEMLLMLDDVTGETRVFISEE